MATPKSIPSCIITIDGPAGTGKSTVARSLAERLGLDCLDTGALYRAVSLLSLEQDVPPDDGPALSALAQTVELRFDWSDDPPSLWVDERNVSSRIRDLDVSSRVSDVASQPELRAILDAEQRRIAEDHPRLVTEGRDQGSVVFPDADVRFFLDADEAVRAQRRADQMANRGDVVDEAAIRSDIRNRDKVDRSRAAAPLVQPAGSIRIDSTHLTIEEVVERMVDLVHEQISGIGGSS
ncbi:MAG: cytidylate kinase [Phycisphaerae bacterium]|nr:cytidylate kinase [Phycisphaerae bacterium]